MTTFKKIFAKPKFNKDDMKKLNRKIPEYQ